MYYPNSNYYQPQMNQYANVPQPQPQPGLKGRPVSSLEEARVANIDFDGSLFIFPDIANRKIYTKQISMDGTASLNVYELSKIPTVEQINTENFITRDEFQNAMTQIKDILSNVSPQEKPQFNF